MQKRTAVYLSSILICLLPVVLSVSCSTSTEDADNDDAHSHEHAEGNAVVITHRAEGIEIFLEYEYPIEGVPVEFITHVSYIETGEPRTSGPVTFEFTHPSAQPIIKEIPQPARPGIYLPEITFTAAGSWDFVLHVPGDKGGAKISLPPVRVYRDAHDAAHAEAPEEISGISFLKEQQWKLLTKTRPVVSRTLVRRVSAPARVEAKPGLRAVVLPPVAGALIAADGGFPVLGKKVRAGEVLAAVKAPLAGADLFAAETARTQLIADIARADAVLEKEHAAYEREKQIYERVKALYTEQAKSQREMEQAEYELEVARANLRGAERAKQTYEKARKRLETSLGKQEEQESPLVPVTAPIDGIVVAVTAAPGDSVLADEPLFTILDAARVRLVTHVKNATLKSFKTGFPAAYTLEDGSDHEISVRGSLVFTGIELDPETNTVPVVYELDNSDGSFVIGEVFTVHIESEESVQALAIPSNAIVEEEGQPVVYVQISGETFERRIIKTGITDGEYIQVINGLHEGEWIVVDGAYEVRLAAVSTSEVGHGHTH